MNDKLKVPLAVLFVLAAAAALVFVLKNQTPLDFNGSETAVKKQVEEIQSHNRPGDPTVPKEMQKGIALGRPTGK